jgi:hypothetical protein
MHFPFIAQKWQSLLLVIASQRTLASEKSKRKY